MITNCRKRSWSLPEQSSSTSRLVVGLISGTSMDGIDAALVRISGPAAQPRVHLLAFETLAYSATVRQRILRVATGGAVAAGEISQLNFLLGELFAEAALRVCRKAKVSPSRLTAIGSHGQTIFHQGIPTREGGRKIASTLQIAEPSVIAERTGAPVVADFRTADMAAGGQGAPLVPMVDYLLLRDARQGTVALNIGGIANFTVIPAGGQAEHQPHQHPQRNIQWFVGADRSEGGHGAVEYLDTRGATGGCPRRAGGLSSPVSLRNGVRDFRGFLRFLAVDADVHNARVAHRAHVHPSLRSAIVSEVFSRSPSAYLFPHSLFKSRSSMALPRRPPTR